MQPTTHIGHVTEAHDLHHEELGFWRKYIFSTDHKVIGLQYAMTALAFLLFGFFLVSLMRWQLAYPGKSIPVLGGLLHTLLGDDMMAKAPTGGYSMLPDLYNAFGAMHGTIMVF